MNRTQLEILTIIIVVASIIGLGIIGLILIARIPPYYLAILTGGLLWLAAIMVGLIIPALEITILIVSILVGGVVVGLIVRKFMSTKGCFVATTAGLVGGTAFVTLVVIFNLVAAELL